MIIVTMLLSAYFQQQLTYLIFVISFTQAGFLNPKFLHPKTMQNTWKLQQIPPKSVKYAVLCVQSGKFYTGQIFFYTGTARGARDKYEVCSSIRSQYLDWHVVVQTVHNIWYCHSQSCSSCSNLLNHLILHPMVLPHTKLFYFEL